MSRIWLLQFKGVLSIVTTEKRPQISKSSFKLKLNKKSFNFSDKKKIKNYETIKSYDIVIVDCLASMPFLNFFFICKNQSLLLFCSEFHVEYRREAPFSLCKIRGSRYSKMIPELSSRIYEYLLGSFLHAVKNIESHLLPIVV